MPQDLHWRTYTGRQAGQIITALQALLDAGTLGEKEIELANKIKVSLKRATKGDMEISMVPFTGEEEDLLEQVEGALWK